MQLVFCPRQLRKSNSISGELQSLYTPHRKDPNKTHLCSVQISQAWSSYASMLLVFSDPEGKLIPPIHSSSICTQLTLSFMDGDCCFTIWPMNFPPCLFLHINSNYLGKPHPMHKTINIHSYQTCAYNTRPHSNSLNILGSALRQVVTTGRCPLTSSLVSRSVVLPL
jgi:hypothetical protein